MCEETEIGLKMRFFLSVTIRISVEQGGIIKVWNIKHYWLDLTLLRGGNKSTKSCPTESH